MTRLSLAALLFVFVGCTTTQVYIPSEARPGIARQLEGEDRSMKVSFFVTPFFGDASKKLLSPVQPDELRILENTDGTPMHPGAVEAVFPAGTLVRIKRVEFPSAFTLTERMLVTPRTLVWLYLDVGGTPKTAPPYVLVLRPGIKDETEFMSEVERYLGKEVSIKNIEDTISTLSRLGVRVLLVSQGPSFQFDNPYDYHWISGRKFARVKFEPEITQKILSVRGAGAYFDPMAAMCSGQTCPTSATGGWLYLDDGHLTDLGSQLQMQQMIRPLRALISGAPTPKTVSPPP